MKGLLYQPEFVNILKDEHKSEENAAMNPSGVPTLEIRSGDDTSALLTQSLAILEYIEETHEVTPLLPPTTDPLGRGGLSHAYLISPLCLSYGPLSYVSNFRADHEKHMFGRWRT